MKRSPLARKTPLKSGGQLAPGAGFKRAAPMARGTSRMRNSKPAADKPKRAARNAGPNYLAMCRGQRCYLAIAGICNYDSNTVVPCHSNSLARGKGMGLKVPDIFTVPGCACCHYAIDAGKDLAKEERREIWEVAYAAWEIDRRRIYGS